MRRLLPCVVLALSACRDPVAPVRTETPDDAPTTLATAWTPVREPSDLAVLEAPARALPDEGSVERISAGYPLRVLRVHVAAGDVVDAGAPIVDVSSSDVLAAAAAYEGTRARLETERGRLAEVRALRNDGYATEERVFVLEREERSLEASMHVAAATIRAADLSPRDAARLLARGAITLCAHVAGVVREVDVVPGDVRVQGGTFATIVGGRSRRVEARFATRPPQDGTFVFEDRAGARTPLGAGPVRMVDGGELGGVIAWFDLPDEAAIAPRTEGHVHVTLESPDYLEVPTAALVEEGEHAIVVRRRAGAVARVEVAVAAASGASAIVHGDLRPGDEVAADGSASPESRADEGAR